MQENSRKASSIGNRAGSTSGQQNSQPINKNNELEPQKKSSQNAPISDDPFNGLLTPAQ